MVGARDCCVSVCLTSVGEMEATQVKWQMEILPLNTDSFMNFDGIPRTAWRPFVDQKYVYISP